MVTYDKSPHSTVAVCHCGWRTVADRAAAKKLGAAHTAKAHPKRDTPPARK